MIKKKDLIDFEKKIVVEYNEGRIPYPVHLSSGTETFLINIFKKIKKEDWVFTNWRSHYHLLLKTQDKNLSYNLIKRGSSMYPCSKKHKIFGSAIVGGIIPIALGVALSMKLRKKKTKVWVFIGDMTFETGTFEESYKYAINHKLPIKWVVEDNDLSTNTPTSQVWVKKRKLGKNIFYKKYKRKFPHHGTGKYVLF